MTFTFTKRYQGGTGSNDISRFGFSNRGYNATNTSKMRRIDQRVDT